MCRGTTDGDACDCEEYDKSQDPSALSKCMECGHGKSKHGPGNVQQAGSKSTVLDIFTARSEKHINDLLPATSRVTDLSTARHDALKGFRVTADPEKRPKKKGKVESKPNNELRGSSKAPSLVDLEHKALYGCIAKDVVIQHDWTHAECTERLTELFPNAFAYASQQARGAEGALWVILSKEYQRLRIVPNVAPTGADLAAFKVDKKTGPKGLSLYIALTKSVPDTVYKSWYIGPSKQDSSSDIEIEKESNSRLSDDSAEENSSDYNPANDPDAVGVKLEGIPGRYRTRPTPMPSMRKRESMAAEEDSDDEVVAVKKQKLGSGKSHTTRTASTSSRPDPLFLQDSDSDNDLVWRSASVAGPPRVSARVSSIYAPPRSVSAGNSQSVKCLSCRRVSAPPAFVTRKLSLPWDDESLSVHPSSYINPWDPAYKPPAC
ncbi:hypothetical protein B0H11DRAFT_2310310 [Mycena galericulata]|nr:hypothetical protein B0H11DRAFT_2310310 [Mycena galericulata]